MRRVKYIILSVLSLLNIIFLPAFDVWGGLFPSSYDNFFEIVDEIFTDKYAMHYWSVIIVLSVLIPSIFMLISAVCDKKVLFSVSSALGIILWLRIAIMYINQFDIEEFFDFNNGSLSIGFWISIIVFVIAFFIGITSQKRYSEVQPVVPINNITKAVENNGFAALSAVKKGTFCPNCGNKRDEESLFCGKCGYKF